MGKSDESQKVPAPLNALVVGQSAFDALLGRTFKRQRGLVTNSNFYIEGFDRYTYGTLLQAFAQELGLVKIDGP